MTTTLNIIQIILSLALAVLIFLQSNDDNDSRGNILSTVSFQKRGWEKALFYFTLVVLTLFLLSTFIGVIS